MKTKKKFGDYLSKEINRDKKIRSKVNFKRLINEATLNFNELDDSSKVETMKTIMMMMLNLLNGVKDIQFEMDKLD